MLRMIAEELSLVMVANKIIPIEDRRYYIYGIELVLNNVLICLFIAAIAIITKTILISIIFSLSFCMLRAYTGGYHSKTYLRCFCISVINYIVMLILNETLEYKFILSCVFLGISVPLIIKFAPVEHKNKPLSIEQKKRYKRISILILSLITAGFIATCFFSKLDISFAISWATFGVFILLFFPKIHLNGGKKYENTVT